MGSQNREDLPFKAAVTGSDYVVVQEADAKNARRYYVTASALVGGGTVIGTNVQAWDADLDLLAGVTVGASTFLGRKATGAVAAMTVAEAYALLKPSIPYEDIIAVGDETTALTVGTAKVTFRMPCAVTLSSVRISLTTASSSGLPTVNVKQGGVTIFTTKPTIDATELTSTTAVTASVLSVTALTDDASITIDIDVAGTGAAGLKVTLIGVRA